MQKPSKSMDIDPILMNFARYIRLIYINWHAKNEENLRHGFRDRPIATVRQPDSDWGSGCIVTLSGTSLRARVMSPRAWRHIMSGQNGTALLSMTNFEFSKSDHY